jgi:hypothetical protein
MPDTWTFRIATSFTDSRLVLDVKYDIEKRINHLLLRDPEQPDALVFRAYQTSYTTGGGLAWELRLEAACETQNFYTLQFDTDTPSNPAMEKTWEQNVRRSMARWTNGLAVTEERVPSSADRYRQVVEETTARELELANQVRTEDDAGIRAVQESILNGLRGGKSFSTAHHEGGTVIKFLQTGFVLADYGESTAREEFTSEAEFLARLRKFYDGESRRDWTPHAPPEIEAWKFIARQMRG